MPGSTTRDKLRFPVGGDAPNVPQDITNLANDVENLRVFVATRDVKEVGQLNQTRAGRVLAVADFNTYLGMNQPVGLFNLSALTNLGYGAALVNKGSVPFAPGIMGAAGEAALFAGSTAQALYIADVGGADPFRLKTGSVGAWQKTAKRGSVDQVIVSKYRSASGNQGYALQVDDTSLPRFFCSMDGSTSPSVVGVSDVADDKWHFIVATFDGTVLRLYVDGVLEGETYFPGTAFGAPVPLNIGGFGADGATVAAAPHFGRIDEAFVTGDVLSEDQIRFLMCYKLTHGFVPGALVRTARKAGMTVKRRIRGASLVVGDFPATPVRLYNFTAGVLTDASGNAITFGTNPLTGAIDPAAGASGTASDGISFSGAHQGLSATDAGMPGTTATRSFGLWFKTTSLANSGIIGWGTVNTADARIAILGGLAASLSGADSVTGPFVADGRWHHAVCVEENAPSDGVKRKLYIDGKLVAGSSTLTSLTLAGANKFRIGTNPDGTSPFAGQVDGAFVLSVALTAEQISALYQKSSQDLGVSPKNAGDHVDRLDNTYAFLLCETLEPQHQFDLEISS